MYNANFKNRFLEEEIKNGVSENMIKAQKSMFEFTEKMEEMYQKDLCLFNAEELIGMYTSKGSYSTESLLTYNGYMKPYGRFCLQEEMIESGINLFEQLGRDELSNCIHVNNLKKSIVTKEEIYRIIDQLDEAYEAFILLAIFEGIKGAKDVELANVKPSDFDGLKVKLITGREFIVSQKLKDLAIESASQYNYAILKGDELYIWAFDENDPCCVKGFSRKNTGDKVRQKDQHAQRVISKIKAEYGYDWTKKTIFDSGIIDDVNRLKREAGGEKTSYQIMLENKSYIERRWKKIKNIKAFINKYKYWL